ncbi:MAG TPA: protein phosphatase 2C domain-containing protein [Pyrinomonadaceae bacterium]|jgi:protein phosphatase
MTDNNFQIHSAAVSDRGLSEKRPQNEDSFLEMKNLGLFAVADGVGGAQAGDVASQMAMEILGEAFFNLQSNGDAEEKMKIAIERANAAIFQMSNDLPQLSTMATTIVALHVDGNIATIGHVGDSRLYRLDGKGSLYRETQDHSVVEEEVRAGRMTAAQAANHPSRNVISRALGAEGSVDVEMKTIMFDGNTKFLLCSDGITRHINDFELRELLLLNAEPSEICAKMKEICYSRGAEDNLTAVIVNIFRTAEENIQDLPTVMPHPDEEATVAAARQFASPPAPVDLNPDDNEIPTRALEMPASMQPPAAAPKEAAPAPQNFAFEEDDESYLMAESAPEAAPAASEKARAAAAADASNAVREAPRQRTAKPFESPGAFSSYETPEKTSGAGGRFLSGLIWLALGLILGGAAVYAWQMMSAKPPEVPALTPQSNDIQKAEMNKSRTNAETNPHEFIKQYQTALPGDASEFYLLGRAHLKLKNYEEAKKNFILARNNLKDVGDAQTKAILETDIAQGLTIAQDKAAQIAFERESNVLNGPEPAGAANSNR